MRQNIAFFFSVTSHGNVVFLAVMTEGNKAPVMSSPKEITYLYITLQVSRNVLNTHPCCEGKVVFRTAPGSFCVLCS